jgi:3-phenylpropionate/trans-cinnamate dioxygenase ferredoxin subunit
MALTRVTTVNELPPGAAMQVVVNGKTIALFNINGTFHAIDDVCTHRGASLSEGLLDGVEIVCPWHGARFDVTTGQHLCPPATKGLTCYRVEVAGDDVQIDL